MNFAKARSLFIFWPALILLMGCEHNQIDLSVPRITKIAAPQSVELPNAVNLTCEVENPESRDLQFNWDSSSGIIKGDSSTVIFFTPPVKSEVTVTCSISDSITIFDKKSTQISVIPPPFVGNYVLKTLHACDSTYTTDNNGNPNLILEIYDTHIPGKGFAYSWKVSYWGLPKSDNCYLQMPDKTHNGFMGKWLQGGRTETDSLIFFSRPYQLGYFVQILKWSKKTNQLIIEKSQADEIWIFEEK